MSEPERDPLKPSTKYDRRDYSLMMTMRLSAIHALAGEWPTDEEIRSWTETAAKSCGFARHGEGSVREGQK